jgi:hypothetical protein
MALYCLWAPSLSCKSLISLHRSRWEDMQQLFAVLLRKPYVSIRTHKKNARPCCEHNLSVHLTNENVYCRIRLTALPVFVHITHEKRSSMRPNTNGMLSKPELRPTASALPASFRAHWMCWRAQHLNQRMMSTLQGLQQATSNLHNSSSSDSRRLEVAAAEGLELSRCPC